MDKLTRTALQIGVTIAGFAYLSHVLKDTQRDITAIAVQSQARIASQAAKASADAAAKVNAQQADDAAATARIRAIVSAQEAELAASRQSSAQADADRDTAWQRYYKRPKECDNPPDYQALVECSNRAIRAREAFNKTYRP